MYKWSKAKIISHIGGTNNTFIYNTIISNLPEDDKETEPSPVERLLTVADGCATRGLLLPDSIPEHNTVYYRVTTPFANKRNYLGIKKIFINTLKHFTYVRSICIQILKL